MTMPPPGATARVVAGLSVPFDLMIRIVAAVRAEYPEVDAAFPDDDDAAVQGALLQWMTDLLAKHEADKARAPLEATVAQTITDFETKANAAKAKALEDAKRVKRQPVNPTYV